MTSYHHRRYKSKVTKMSFWSSPKHFFYFGTWGTKTYSFEEVFPGTPEYGEADFEERFVPTPYIGETAWINPMPFIPEK